MIQVTQILGFIGTIIVAAGYLPQIIHIAKEGCSAGVSVRAWACWLIASLMMLSHALALMDVVFMALQVINIAAIVCIIVLARKYERMTCASHRVHDHVHTTLA